MEREFFPDGTPIDEWFYDTAPPAIENMGKQYVLTDYDIFDDGKVYTREIQAVIDTAANAGGGVIVVPKGTYISGALYFKRGVNLCVKKGGTLKGSESICDYNVCLTRIEGETCRYFDALINADGADGFTVFGEGTIDGNGLKSWKAFWLRREWNENCTNKDEQRPRLLYVSNSENVTIYGLKLQNSHFWTTHFYKCGHVKILNCGIFSPKEPVPAPSTDAIDLDVCHDVLIKSCRIHVNDDSIVLKGGKGPNADKLPENGINERIIAEDCEYGFCHGCLTCGSESVHSKNIILRRCTVEDAHNLLWLKMRPDTPQCYEYITVENVCGRVTSFLNINPWTQFFDNGGEYVPPSAARHITLKDCECECDVYLNVTPDKTQYVLSDFSFENLKVCAKNLGCTEFLGE